MVVWTAWAVPFRFGFTKKLWEYTRHQQKTSITICGWSSNFQLPESVWQPLPKGLKGELSFQSYLRGVILTRCKTNWLFEPPCTAIVPVDQKPTNLLYAKFRWVFRPLFPQRKMCCGVHPLCGVPLRAQIAHRGGVSSNAACDGSILRKPTNAFRRNDVFKTLVFAMFCWDLERNRVVKLSVD